MRFKQTLLSSNKDHPIKAEVLIARSWSVKGTQINCHTGKTKQENKVIFVTCDTSGRQSSSGVTGHRMSLDVHVVFNPLVQLWVIDHTRLEVMESNPIHTNYLESRAGTGLASSRSLELYKSEIAGSATP